MNVKEDLTELIGNTPLVYLKNFSRNRGVGSNLIGKLEFYNPTGSIKDRAAYSMILSALNSGEIDKNTTIVEPTSGNTGIGLAGVSAALGLKLKIVLPDSFSVERRTLLKALGAELILTPGAAGMSGAIEKARQITIESENHFMPQQFTNSNNPKAHRETTALEIWNDLDGEVDFVVAGVGTGGTITGLGEALKEKNPDIKIVAVEPLESAVLCGGEANTHKIQGIGAGFIPEILNLDIIDKFITVPGEKAIEAAREVARADGLMVGISSGAALCAGIEVLKQNPGKRVVVILPDGGERYISSELYQ